MKFNQRFTFSSLAILGALLSACGASNIDSGMTIKPQNLPTEAQALAKVTTLELDKTSDVALLGGDVKVFKPPELTAGKFYVVKIGANHLDAPVTHPYDASRKLMSPLIFFAETPVTAFKQLEALDHSFGDSSTASQYLFKEVTKTQSYTVYLTGNPGNGTSSFWVGNISIGEAPCTDGHHTIPERLC